MQKTLPHRAASAALLLGAILAPAAAARAASTPFEWPHAAQIVTSTLARASSTLALQGGAPQSGEVVITEFMKDPNSVVDTRGEWFEVYNNLPWRVNLEGWKISDDSGAQHIITNGGAGVRIRPGHYAVLGISADPALNGGVAIDYQYSSFSLGNGADQIILSKPNGVVVDRVAYDDGVLWPDSAGKSIGVRLASRDSTLNDDPTQWCHATTPISATNPDTGTPHLDNDVCP